MYGGYFGAKKEVERFNTITFYFLLINAILGVSIATIATISGC